MKYVELIKQWFFQLASFLANWISPLIERTGVFTDTASSSIATGCGYVISAVLIFKAIALILQFIHKFITAVTGVLFVQSTTAISRLTVGIIRRIFATVAWCCNNLFGWLFRFGRK